MLGIKLELRSEHLLQTTLPMVAQRSISRSFKSDSLSVVLLEVICYAGSHVLVMALASSDHLTVLGVFFRSQLLKRASRIHVVT